MKTDLLRLPQDVEWRKNLLEYIVQNKIITVKKIPYNQVVNEICPGQTSASLQLLFSNDLSGESKDGKQARPKAPLYDICLKRLEEPYINSYLGNEKKADSKLTYANEILEIRDLILKGAYMVI